VDVLINVCISAVYMYVVKCVFFSCFDGQLFKHFSMKFKPVEVLLCIC